MIEGRTRRVLLSSDPLSPRESGLVARSELSLLGDSIASSGANNLGGVVEVTKVGQTSLAPELHFRLKGR